MPDDARPTTGVGPPPSLERMTAVARNTRNSLDITSTD